MTSFFTAHHILVPSKTWIEMRKALFRAKDPCGNYVFYDCDNPIYGRNGSVRYAGLVAGNLTIWTDSLVVVESLAMWNARMGVGSKEELDLAEVRLERADDHEGRPMSDSPRPHPMFTFSPADIPLDKVRALDKKQIADRIKLNEQRRLARLRPIR